MPSVSNIPATTSRGTILIVHGVCEHSGRYQEFQTFLNQHGYSTIIPDLPGHGRSPGVRTHLSSRDEYLHYLLELVKSSSINSPFYLLGHSMGGLLAARLTQLWQDQSFSSTSNHLPALQGVILLSPLFGVKHPVPLWKFILGKLLYNIYPQIRFKTEIAGSELMSDPEKIKAWETDPLMSHGVTAGWFFLIEELISITNQEASKFNLPLLLLQSGDDQIVNPKASQAFFNQIQSTDKTYQLLPDHKHELLNEPDRLSTIRIILDWLNNHPATNSV